MPAWFQRATTTFTCAAPAPTMLETPCVMPPMSAGDSPSLTTTSPTVREPKLVRTAAPTPTPGEPGSMSASMAACSPGCIRTGRASVSPAPAASTTTARPAVSSARGPRRSTPAALPARSAGAGTGRRRDGRAVVVIGTSRAVGRTRRACPADLLQPCGQAWVRPTTSLRAHHRAPAPGCRGPAQWIGQTIEPLTGPLTSPARRRRGRPWSRWTRRSSSPSPGW